MSGEGRLIRNLLPFERSFTQIPNAWLRDSRLSFKARGLLAMLMTHEQGWKVGITTIANDAQRDGRDSVLTAVRELEELGYLVRHPRRGGGRFTAHDWELADPSGLSDPALFGRAYAGIESPRNSHRGGKSRTVKRGLTVAENLPDTVAENLPPLRTLEEDIKTPSAPYVRRSSYPQAGSERCPRRGDVGHLVIDDTGVCTACAQRIGAQSA